MKQKSRFSMILMVIALFGVFFGMEKVSAKAETILTCRYMYDNAYGKNAIVDVNVRSDKVAEAFLIRYNSNVDEADPRRVPLKNWRSGLLNLNLTDLAKEVMDTKTCPKYLLLYNNFDVDYLLWARLGNDFSGETPDDYTYILKDINTIDVSDDVKEANYETIKGYISEINNAATELDEKEEECYTNSDSECDIKKLKTDFKNLLTARELQVNDMARNRWIDQNNETVIEFRKLINKYKPSDGYVDPSDGIINRDYDICSIFSGTLGDIVKSLISWIKLLIPIVIIVLGIMDAISVVVSGEEKKMKEVFSRFLKRMIAGLLIIFVPSLISFLVNLSGVLEPYHIDDIWCGLWG